MKRDRSLIDQSLHSRLGATTTNGDGFGVGWYDTGGTPRLYRSTHPAWNDRNLRELAAGVSSPLFLAHIRASTGTAIQETNTHPVPPRPLALDAQRPDPRVPAAKRELVLAVDDSLYPSIEGTTDSETFFYLALSFGLERRPGGRRRADRRLHRGGGAQARRRTPDPDDGRHDRRNEHLGVPVLERGRLAVSLLQHAHGRAEGALPGQRARVAVRRDPGRRLRAARRPPRGLERGAESHVGIVQPGQDDLRPFTPRAA